MIVDAFGETRRPCPECGRPMYGTKARPHCYSWDCATGRARRQAADAARRATYKRRKEVREPPPWPFKKVAGACNLCGTDVPKPRRSWCSAECVAINELSRFPDVARHQLLWVYDGCHRCGARTWKLDVDHRRPLWSLTPAERGELRWWLPFNLWLLCDECHKAKTKWEAAARAQGRNIADGNTMFVMPVIAHPPPLTKPLARLKPVERPPAVMPFVGHVCTVTYRTQKIGVGYDREIVGKVVGPSWHLTNGNVTGDLVIAPLNSTEWKVGDERYAVVSIALIHVGTIEPAHQMGED